MTMARNKTFILFAVLVSVLLIGSFFIQNAKQPSESPEPFAQESLPEETAAPSVTQAAEVATEPAVEETVETVPAQISLNVDSGAFQKTHECIATDQKMDYYLFLPENAVEDMPLIIFLHGVGQVGHVEGLEDYGLMESATDIYGWDFPFIAISPCTWVKSWTLDYVYLTLKDLIDSVADTYCVDKDRIIITGHSLGALGVWHMVQTYGDYFSAAVPVSGNPKKTPAEEGFLNVPVWAFAGGAGSSYESQCQWHMGKAVKQITDFGGQAQLTVYDNLDHIQMKTAPYSLETIEWMLAQGTD